MSGLAPHLPTDDLEAMRLQLEEVIDALESARTHPDDPAFLRDLRAAAKGEKFDIPQLPEELVRVRRVLADPEAGPRELARAIRHNPVLAARFMVAARSAHYAGVSKIQTLEEAIMRVGLKQSTAWVTAFVLHASLFSGVAYRHESKRVFRHSLAAAVNAELIAQMTRPDLAGDAFVAALLHDFGRVFVVAIAGGVTPDRSHDRGAPSRAMLERASDELHAMFSGVLAESWGFAQPIVTAVLAHHDALPSTSEGEDPFALTRILQAADLIAHQMIEAIDEAKEIEPITIDILGSYDAIEVLLEEAKAAYWAFDDALA